MTARELAAEARNALVGVACAEYRDEVERASVLRAVRRVEALLTELVLAATPAPARQTILLACADVALRDAAEAGDAAEANRLRGVADALYHDAEGDDEAWRLAQAWLGGD